MGALNITDLRRELREIRDRVSQIETALDEAKLPGRDGGALDAHVSTAVDSLTAAYGAALDIEMARRVADLKSDAVDIYNDAAVAADGRA